MVFEYRFVDLIMCYKYVEESCKLTIEAVIMYAYSKSHGEKIYHTQFCSCATRIKCDNLGYFRTLPEAREKGKRKNH